VGIRLVVIDGHTLCRHGLAGIVAAEPDMEIVGEAGTLAEGLRAVAARRPEVVLAATQLSDTDGLGFVHDLRGSHPCLGIVVMAAAETDDPLFRAMEAGASAYVRKSAPVEDFLAAIRSAAVAPSAFTAAGLVEALRRRRGGELLLSPRERQVLGYLVQGLSIAAMGRAMNLSHSTAKTYTGRLYEKLGAANRAQALMTAVRLGLVRQEDLRESIRPPSGVPTWSSAIA
jgi:DNA-binding NarL/FixJ family response regulator